MSTDFEVIDFLGKDEKSYVIHTPETLYHTPENHPLNGHKDKTAILQKVMSWVLSLLHMPCGNVVKYAQGKLNDMLRGAKNHEIFMVFNNVDDLKSKIEDNTLINKVFKGFLILTTGKCGNEDLAEWATIDVICIKDTSENEAGKGKGTGIGSKLVSEVIIYLKKKGIKKVAVEIGGGYFNNPGSYGLFKKFFTPWPCATDKLPKCFESVPDKCFLPETLEEWLRSIPHVSEHALQSYPMYFDLDLEQRVRELPPVVAKAVVEKFMENTRGGSKKKNKSKKKKSKKNKSKKNKSKSKKKLIVKN